MTYEISPDMVWMRCSDCEKQYTLADVTDNGSCPWCEIDTSAHNTSEYSEKDNMGEIDG